MLESNLKNMGEDKFASCIRTKTKKKVEYASDVEDVSAMEFSQREEDVENMRKSTKRVFSERNEGKAISRRIL